MPKIINTALLTPHSLILIGSIAIISHYMAVPLLKRVAGTVTG